MAPSTRAKIFAQLFAHGVRESIAFICVLLLLTTKKDFRSSGGPSLQILNPNRFNLSSASVAFRPSSDITAVASPTNSPIVLSSTPPFGRSTFSILVYIHEVARDVLDAIQKVHHYGVRL